MIKVGLLLLFAMLAGLGCSTDSQSVKVATDNGANIRAPRRERNPFFAARPVYPPVERGAAARINFEPFTGKYYPQGSETGSSETTDPLIEGR